MSETLNGFAREFDHKQELLDAALEEFIAKGYENASINVILTQAGMSKGQFYYHFKNKEGLYLSLIGVLIERKQAFMATVMQPEDFQQSFFDIVRTQIRYGMQFAESYPAINRFAESFVKAQGSPIYDKALATYNFQQDSAFDPLIAAAYQRGELRDDLPLSFIQHVFGYMLTHTVEIAGLDTADSFEERLGHLMSFLQYGLVNPDTREE
jgi:TetR/AcrR family transcriptional regulator